MSINTKAAEAVIIGTNAAGTKTPDVKKHSARKRTAANKKTKKKDRPKKNAPLKGDKDQSSVFIPVSNINVPTTHESVTPITHEAVARTDFQIPAVEKKMVVKTIESKFAKEIRNVAAYARVSTLQDEQEESYESQVEYYSAFIKSNPLWNFAGMYADKGISGTQATKRPEFMRMIEDARQGKIDLIIVKSISRFARNTLDSISYVHELKELGIEVRFEKEELSSFDSSSDMIFNLLAAMAQEESRSLSENMKWGLRKRAEMGIRRIGNRHMLGYDQEGDKLVPTEDAWIVKYIFEQYAAGALIKDIIAGLKERGAVTMKGKDTFDYTTITGMLKNENYVGDRLIQKQPPINYLTKKPDYTVDYESYFIENDHEPIVDRKTWNAVQERLQKVERHPTWNKTTLDHFLYGKVYCAECGRKCKRLAKHKGKHSWVCTGAKSKACRVVNQIPEQHILYDVNVFLGNGPTGEDLTKEAVQEKIDRILLYPDRSITVEGK